jgi:hypothetical protein
MMRPVAGLLGHELSSGCGRDLAASTMLAVEAAEDWMTRDPASKEGH